MVKNDNERILGNHKSRMGKGEQEQSVRDKKI